MQPQDLLARIRGEYSEMPGLRLTVRQACRLWTIDSPTCLAVLEQLVDEGYLFQAHDGAYIALPVARPTPATAALRVVLPATGTDARRRG